MPLTAGLIIGLLIGAGVVAGAWWWADRDSGALPPPIPISLATLPSEILGAQRDDLAAQAGSGKNAKDNAQRQRSMITARIPAYDAAYGGSGIDASYGALAGSRMYRLMIVNGIQPSPVATPDASVASLGLLAPSDYVEAPGSATTRCVAQPHAPVVINGDTTVAAARDQVLADPQSIVTCVRSNRARNLSVQVQAYSVATGGPPASSAAPAIAAEVDHLWASLAG